MKSVYRSACLFAAMMVVPAMVHAAEPPITAIAIAPDGQYVAIGSQAGIGIANQGDLETTRRVRSAVVNIHQIQFSPNGEWIAVAGGTPAEEGLVELMRWPKLEQRVLLRGFHDDSVLAISWIDDERLLSGALDHRIALWSLPGDGRSGPEVIRSFAGHSRGVSSLAVVGAGMIVSGSLDQNIRVWDQASTEIIRTLNNHTGEVTRIRRRSISEGLPMIASIGQDRTVRFWQPTIGRLVRFQKLDTTPNDLAWTPNGKRLVVVTSDGQLLSLDPDTAEVANAEPVTDGVLHCVAVSPTGDAYAAGYDGRIHRVGLTQ